jgi:AAA15 family ATPase/GTPase
MVISASRSNFLIEEESAGTRDFLNKISPIIDVLKNGHVLFIDELDNSLHPLLTKYIIQLFESPKTNPNNAQLIFSTHAINLLENNLFRRDQIWFTDKNEYGVSDLYSLAQFEGIRKGMPLDKWYLSGRFGATPILSDPDIKF